MQFLKFFFIVGLMFSLMVKEYEAANIKSLLKHNEDIRQDYIKGGGGNIGRLASSSKTMHSLCGKDRQENIRFSCYCFNEEKHYQMAYKAECWIFSKDLTRNDSLWSGLILQKHLKHLELTIDYTGSLNYIPENIMASLSDLRIFKVEYATFTIINSYALGNLTKLNEIHLPNNNIKFLNIYSFANHFELKTLNLFKNTINNIAKNRFVNLPNLLILNLANNNITQIDDNAFAELNKLKELYINNNLINNIHINTFNGLQSLQRLNLAGNNIKYLNNLIFNNIPKVIEIHLNDNKINKIDEDTLAGLKYLKEINLSNNTLNVLEDNLFLTTFALNIINLNYNNLKTIDEVLFMPIMDNLINDEESLITIEDNQLICDCRLKWIFILYNITSGHNIRKSLKTIKCYLDPDILFNFDSINITKNSNAIFSPLQLINLIEFNAEYLPCSQDLLPLTLPNNINDAPTISTMASEFIENKNTDLNKMNNAVNIKMLSNILTFTVSVIIIVSYMSL